MVASDGANPIRKVLGLGFFVQGFRCFPWMAVSFFLKDGLNVDPSTLQVLQNSANLPMVAKPLYGIFSDAVYISGQHRIPYIAIGALLQAVSWLALAILSPKISIITISVYLLLSNLGASIAEVANDAVVAESGKQATSSKKTQSSSSGELQSYVCMASSLGGILGNLLGGILIERLHPQHMFLLFGLLLFLQFLLTIAVRESSLNLPKAPSNMGIRKQLSELSDVLRRPEIVLSLAWFAASYAVIPSMLGTMFFYQTQYLKIDSSVLGISKVFGQAALLVWSVMYDRYMKSIPSRTLIAGVQALMAVLMISDVLFVKGVYREMGVPDSVYVVIFSGLLEVLFFFKILPFSVLMAKLCKPGCEGSLMAFVFSAIALAFILSGYLGVALASYVGVTGIEFSALPVALVIQALCTLLPLSCSWCIPDDTKPRTGTKEE